VQHVGASEYRSMEELYADEEFMEEDISRR
jgi:hypothetical protein